MNISIKLIFFCLFANGISCQFCNSSLGHFSGQCNEISNCIGGAFISRNCSNNQICCVTDPEMSQDIFREPTYFNFSINSFLKFVGDTARNRAMYSLFSKALDDSKVDNCHLAAVYFTQAASETKLFTKFESDRSEKDIDTDLGNDQVGDGLKFKRRGPFPLTGKSNYILANSKLSDKLVINITEIPESLVLPSTGFLVGSWVWNENLYVLQNNKPAQKGNLNALVDGTYFNFTQITYSITSNLVDLKERSILYEKTVDELKCPRIKRGFGIVCEVQNEKGYAVPDCLADHKRPYCGCDGAKTERGCPYGFNSKNTCRNSPLIKCCLEKCFRGLDLAFLIDASDSIKLNNFVKIKKFLQNFVNKLEISENRTRFSLVKFSTDIEPISYLSNFTSKDSILNLIDQMNYDSGITNTGSALKFLNEEILNEQNGMRKVESGYPRVVVLVTDGQSNEDFNLTVKMAEEIKAKGVNIISLGIGKEINLKELETISSSLDNIYLINAFDELNLVLDNMIKTACQQPAKLILETEITSRVDLGDSKYFVFESNDTLNTSELTFEIENVKGRTNIYISDTDETPKNDSEYVPIEESNSTEVFIEGRTMEKFYSKNILLNQTNKLYFGIAGLSQENEFKIKILVRTSNSTNETTSNSTNDTTSNSTNESTQTSPTTQKPQTMSTLSYLTSFFTTTRKNNSPSSVRNFTALNLILPLITLVCFQFHVLFD
ncbi:unnamed protein product [Brachionus calyciflorus]|uniref:VWFA domain-containing protein n=1 Tax=Brachionus calyciflorus TaxID=104777 RepID=A0A813NCC2_9BILA|nr:unnamed protein product [Brachionus calyciflorus]